MNVLNGRQVLILGGSSGIGLATARLAGERGAIVTIASRSRSRLDEALKTLPEGVSSGTLDLRDDADVVRFFDKTQACDYLIISGAETPMGTVRDLSFADAYAAMDSKFWGIYRAVRAARIAAGGSITLVAGTLSVRPLPGVGVQCAVNAAVEALGRALALEYAPIRVNTVSTGLIATPLWDNMPPEAREGMYARAAARLPVKRVGQPEDAATLILEVATNGFATGSTFYIDGGALITS